jgi:PQQ-dependent dehydrogenase (methanol/ethanol family)
MNKLSTGRWHAEASFFQIFSGLLTLLIPPFVALAFPALFWAQNPAPQSPASTEAGRVFATRCAVCHGSDARGGQYGPGLAGNNDLRERSVSWLRDVIRKGVPSAGMPAFDLSSRELDGVAALVHSLNLPAAENAVPGERPAGEQYFFGKGKCASCHMVSGKGSAVGPDLSSIGRDMSVEEIRTSLLEPSVRIAPGYEAVTVHLRNGQTIRGFARSQSSFEVAMQDSEGQFHLLQESEISSLTRDEQSAMPRIEASPEELQNLIAYLSGLNGVKPGTAAMTARSESPGVSFSEILNPKPGDWLTYNGNLSGNRYSELAEINTANASQMQLKWIYTVPLWKQFYPDTAYFRENLQYFGLETVPLVADGIMYATGPQQVFALDARTGQQIWSWVRPRTPGIVGDAALGSNRGLAILGDKLFMVTHDAHLIALNRTTGQLVWEAVMPEKPMHFGGTVAPLVVKDMVLAGVAGGDWGIRGFIAAYRASDGKLMWRRWTVPDKKDPEAKTWGGNPPETGGGGTWITGSYDPETDTLYWATGNPYPDSDDRDRPGDNLYTNCILALNPADGSIKWFYQVTPHDVHDWDATAPVVLVDTLYQGQPRKLLLHADKNGFFYVLDRTNGHLLVAKPFVKVSWASGIGADGRPQRVAENGVLCPEAGSNWNGTAFSPLTRKYFVMAVEKCDVDFSANWKKQNEQDQIARKYLEALDVEDGKVAWRIPEIGPADGKRDAGILATAGGLLFYGNPGGDIVAADANDGKALWHFPTNGENKTSPITYTVNGKQFVVLSVGPNILGFALP